MYMRTKNIILSTFKTDSGKCEKNRNVMFINNDMSMNYIWTTYYNVNRFAHNLDLK